MVRLEQERADPTGMKFEQMYLYSFCLD